MKNKLYYDDGKEVRCGDCVEHTLTLDDNFDVGMYVGEINYDKGTFSLETDMGCLGDSTPENLVLISRVEENVIEDVLNRLEGICGGLSDVYGSQIENDVLKAVKLLENVLENIKGT